ncbi:MAG: hypothetical protein Q9163_001729 [Psora crenata]
MDRAMSDHSSDVDDISDWELEEGLPQFQDQFIQQYLNGREALIEQEKSQWFVIDQALATEGIAISASQALVDTKDWQVAKVQFHFRKSIPDPGVSIIVGQEDIGRSLADLIPELFWFRKRCVENGIDIPLFFYAGEYYWEPEGSAMAFRFIRIRAERMKEWTEQWNKFCEWIVLEYAIDYGGDEVENYFPILTRDEVVSDVRQILNFYGPLATALNLCSGKHDGEQFYTAHPNRNASIVHLRGSEIAIMSSYFLPSFLQKRLLRYALSRFELLDTDALNLDNLDITWGRRSTVELRDVGIHVKKLCALLQLPRPFSIVRARVILLRLTIPSDLYQSGILVEVHGVDIQVREDSESSGKEGKPSSKVAARNYDSPSKEQKADRPRSTQSYVHDPGGFRSSDTESDDGDTAGAATNELPTTTDLAQSFLQTEALEKTAELQAAILQSQTIDQTQVSEGSIQEASAVGLGGDLSLPAFLAGFLKGVVDRIEVQIKDVQLDFDLQLHVSPENSMGSGISERSEHATFRVTIGAVAVDGMGRPKAKEAPLNGPNTPLRQAHESRHISLNNINFMMLSESALFSQIARSPIPSSPSTTQASTVVAKRRNTSHPPIFNEADVEGSIESQQAVSDQYTSSSSSIVCQSYKESRNSHGVPGIKSEALLDSGFIARGITGGGTPLTNSFFSATGESQVSATPQYSLHNLDPSFYPKAGDRSSSDLSLSQALNRDDSQGLQGKLSPQARSKIFPDAATGAAAAYAEPADTEVVHAKMASTTKSRSLAAEDLTGSKIFSHEEASSMYMSAMSQTTLDRDNSMPGLPGGWDSGFSDRGQEHGQKPKLSGDLVSSGEPSSIYDPLSDSPGEAVIPATFTLQDARRTSTPKAALSAPSYSVQGESNQVAERATAHDSAAQSRASSEASGSSANGKPPVMLAKKFLHVDNVDLEIFTHTILLDADASKGSAPGPSPNSRQGSTRPRPTSSNREKPARSLSIDINNIQIVCDMTLLKMTLLVVQQINKRIRLLGSTSKRTSGSARPKSQPIDLKFNIRSLAWGFLDLVKGQALPADLSPKVMEGTTSIAADSEVLLKAEVAHLEVMHKQAEVTATSKISVGKFRFGYAGADIVSFDSSLKMRDSTRDMLAPSDADMLLSIGVQEGTRRIELSTLPLRIMLDLRRLDETFSWFGGLSSMLDLGNSMKSTMMIVEPQRSSPETSKPNRGVHFQVTESYSRPGHARDQSQNKVTARIGGVVLELQGNQSALRFEGTAIKLVSRAEGIGLVIDRLSLGGPYSGASVDRACLTAKLSNVRVEYLSTPKEADLERLLTLVRPSHEDDSKNADDGLLVNTMLRQRRQGGVVRFTVETLEGSISDLGGLHQLPSIVEDLKQLSTVAKYLPEDDRPGILTLALVRNIEFRTEINKKFGAISLLSENNEAAYVAFPSLLGVGIKGVQLIRNDTEELVGKALATGSEPENSLPPIWVRFIGNEMEPTVEIRVRGLRFEYQVTTIMAIMENGKDIVGEGMGFGSVGSVGSFTNRRPHSVPPAKLLSKGSVSSEQSMAGSRTPNIDLRILGIVIGLNPRDSLAKGLLVLEEAHILSSVSSNEKIHTTLEGKRVSMMVINNYGAVLKSPKFKTPDDFVGAFTSIGYVQVGTLFATKLSVQISSSRTVDARSIDTGLEGGLLLLETCADSTQTLQHILNGLSPPRPKSTEVKYRTEVVPIEDMLASFSGDAYEASERSLAGDEEQLLKLGEGDMVDEVPQNLEFVSSFYSPDPQETSRMVTDSMLEGDVGSIASLLSVREVGDKTVLESFQEQAQVASDKEPLDFCDDYFGAEPAVGEAALKWDKPSESVPAPSRPLKIHIRDFHIIWNLFDGYDWQHTRDKISQAVADVQSKAAAQRLLRKEKRKSLDSQDHDEDVIGDFLFNSIYIGIPANRDPLDLASQVNRNIDDIDSETGSYATSISSRPPSRQGQDSRHRGKKLRLKRSKHHKMTFELKGIAADLVVFPPGRETQHSIDIRIQDMEIFDHVPTSTWKKFVTYMHDAGEKESGTSMVHIEIMTVKPVPDLAASEIILKVTVLPLRLHVDQDALDFLTRFFEFKDESVPAPALTADTPFLQRVEVNAVRVKLDFKPKRVDYAGLRSGHTTEFMNFFILDQADMILRHVIIYGVSGFDKLGKTLNDIWSPDIKRNQLPGVLAGLGPVRSLVNVGGGVRDLVIVPIREYKKDGRVVRSLQKGAFAFAKTTTSELVKLGAKLAIGTQTVLQGAEDLLTQQEVQGRSEIFSGWEEAELDEEEKKQISLYADQPVGVIQGLRGGYASLERDLLTAKDAIVAMPGEVMESGTAGEVAKVVLRSAPTIILRPAMGVTKVVGQTLMGATNSLDPGSRRRAADKYKSH